MDGEFLVTFVTSVTHLSPSLYPPLVNVILVIPPEGREGEREGGQEREYQCEPVRGGVLLIDSLSCPVLFVLSVLSGGTLLSSQRGAKVGLNHLARAKYQPGFNSSQGPGYPA